MIWQHSCGRVRLRSFPWWSFSLLEKSKQPEWNKVLLLEPTWRKQKIQQIHWVKELGHQCGLGTADHCKAGISVLNKKGKKYIYRFHSAYTEQWGKLKKKMNRKRSPVVLERGLTWYSLSDKTQYFLFVRERRSGMLVGATDNAGDSWPWNFSK